MCVRVHAISLSLSRDLLQELAHAVMGARKSVGLLSTAWRRRKACRVAEPELEAWEPRGWWCECCSEAARPGTGTARRVGHVESWPRREDLHHGNQQTLHIRFFCFALFCFLKSLLHHHDYWYHTLLWTQRSS